MKLDAIGIVVPDMAKAVEFYRLLGVDFPDATEDHIEATLPNGLRLMMDTEDLVKQFTDWVEPQGQRIGLAFLCDSPAEVDAMYQKVLDAGFEGKREPWDAFWGQRYAMILDPAGNSVDLFARL
jgi:catechol 2,3-dioxygenase-like lactoylglutathione lyase family enzyme